MGALLYQRITVRAPMAKKPCFFMVKKRITLFGSIRGQTVRVHTTPPGAFKGLRLSRIYRSSSGFAPHRSVLRACDVAEHGSESFRHCTEIFLFRLISAM